MYAAVVFLQITIRRILMRNQWKWIWLICFWPTFELLYCFNFKYFCSVAASWPPYFDKMNGCDFSCSVRMISITGTGINLQELTLNHQLILFDVRRRMLRTMLARWGHVSIEFFIYDSNKGVFMLMLMFMCLCGGMGTGESPQWMSLWHLQFKCNEVMVHVLANVHYINIYLHTYAST